MTVVAEAPMSRDEWLSARRKTITATDIAAILGVHPYRTPHQVYLDKHGLEPEIQENGPMRWGSLIEPLIAQEFTRETGLATVQAGFTVCPTCEYFGATPDYLIGDDALLECKTAGQWPGKNFGQEGTDEIPDHYLCQVMWQLMVTGRSVGYLAVLIGGQRFRTFTIERDDELVRRMVFHAHRFWNEYVIAENPPPLSGHLPDTQAVNARFEETTDTVVRATSEIESLIVELGEALEAERQAKLAVQERKNRIAAFLADNQAQVLMTDAGNFTWKPSRRSTTDWQAVAAEIGIPGDVIAKHTEVKFTQPVLRTPFRTDKA